MDSNFFLGISAGIFALLGAAIGAATTFVVQRQSLRLEKEKLKDASRARVNLVSVQVFKDFMEACKAVERAAENRQAGEAFKREEIGDITTKMWLRYQELCVFCDPGIRDVAHAFVEGHMVAIWSSPQQEVAEFLAPSRDRLFDVAGPIFREAAITGSRSSQ